MDHSSNIINKIEGKKSEHFSILERFPRTRTICRRSRIFTMLARFFNVPPPLHPLLFYIFPRTNLITAPPPLSRILACNELSLNSPGAFTKICHFPGFTFVKNVVHTNPYIYLSLSLVLLIRLIVASKGRTSRITRNVDIPPPGNESTFRCIEKKTRKGGIEEERHKTAYPDIEVQIINFLNTGILAG